MEKTKNSTKQLPEIKEILSRAKAPLLTELQSELDVLKDIYRLIDKTIAEEPPIGLKEGGLIKKGYDKEIDQLKSATTDG